MNPNQEWNMGHLSRTGPAFVNQDGPNNMRDGLTERQRHARLIVGMKAKVVELERLRDEAAAFSFEHYGDEPVAVADAAALEDTQRWNLGVFESILFPSAEAA